MVNAASNKVGTVRAALGCRGMGLLRLAGVFKDSSGLSINGQENIKVKAIQPEWWPAEWVSNHDQYTAVA